MHREGIGKGCGAFESSLGAPPSQLLDVFSNPKLSESHCLRAFIELNLMPSYSPLPRDGWVRLKVPPSNYLVFLVTSPILRVSRGPESSHLHKLQCH